MTAGSAAGNEQSEEMGYLESGELGEAEGGYVDMGRASRKRRKQDKGRSCVVPAHYCSSESVPSPRKTLESILQCAATLLVPESTAMPVVLHSNTFLALGGEAPIPLGMKSIPAL